MRDAGAGPFLAARSRFGIEPRPDSSVVERGPEKAGVGGSIPSLATTISDQTEDERSRTGSAFRSVMILGHPNRARRRMAHTYASMANRPAKHSCRRTVANSRNDVALHTCSETTQLKEQRNG